MTNASRGYSQDGGERREEAGKNRAREVIFFSPLCDGTMKAEVVSQRFAKGFGGQVGYLGAVLCRFPPAKL